MTILKIIITAILVIASISLLNATTCRKDKIAYITSLVVVWAITSSTVYMWIY